MSCESESESKDECIEGPAMHPKVAAILAREFRIGQRTPKWLAARKMLVTASESGAVLGFKAHPSSTRKSVFRSKTGQTKPFKGNMYTRHGQQFEPIAAKRYEEVTGRTLVHEDIGLLRHLVHLRFGGSPDGVTLCGRLLEIKCPAKRERIFPGKCPDYYLTQLQMLMEIMDLEVADFVQYAPASPWEPEICDVTEIKRDRKFWNDVMLPGLLDFIEELDEFWRENDLPIGGSLIDWEAEERKQYEDEQSETIRECCLSTKRTQP
jgi:putative phage-type endonuclease